MSTLNGPQNWLNEIRRRSEFLENCANNTQLLSQSFGPMFPIVPEGVLVDPVARGQPSQLFEFDLLISAADLALCTDEIERGRGLIEQAVELLREPSAELLFLARKAFYSALVKRAEVFVSASNLRIDDFERSWENLTSIVELDANLASLIFAALATGEPNTHADIVMSLTGADGVSRIARLSFLANPDSAILYLFGILRAPNFLYYKTEEWLLENQYRELERAREKEIFAGRSALAMREYNFENRIALLQSDDIAWGSMAPTNSLIDWILLMIHVALIRRGQTSHLDAIPIAGEATRFIRELAHELA